MRRTTVMGRSQRSIERHLGWAHGSLGNLLRGRTEPTLRHIAELAPALSATPLELLAEVLAEPAAEPDRDDDLPPDLLDLLTYQAAALEQTVETFQHLQTRLTIPTLVETAAMRRGARPMSRAAYVLAQLQTAGIALENVASDLRTDLEYGFEPVAEKSETLFNALDAAVERLLPPAATKADAEA